MTKARKKTREKGQTASLDLASGSAARHPQHKAREIRSFSRGGFVGWSIYPDQIPAMIEAMGKVIYDDVLTSGDAPANCAKKALAAIGVVLVLPNNANDQAASH